MEDFNKTFRMAKEMDKNRLAAARIRIRYLREWIDDCLQDGSDIALHWAERSIAEIEYLLQWGNVEIVQAKTRDDITDHDIEAARNYPIDQLISFDRAGKAIAFCHEDRNPSLSWLKKWNKAKCWPCDKTFDSIAVLMERDGYSFVDAVKQLR